MLIEFSLENYHSIAERQTLSMVASGEKNMQDSNTFPLPNSEKLRLLKSAVLYGANASGKSNILRALYVLKNIVLTSATGRQVKDPLEVEPFRLDGQWSKKNTSFEIIFLQDNVRYQYYIELDQSRIHQEVLNAYPNKVAQGWYSRKYDPETDQYDWHFGKFLKGEKSTIKNFVRPNSLFLSHAAQNNHPQLTLIFNWFIEKLCIFDINNIDLFNFSPSYTAYFYQQNQKNSELVKKFISEADIDIEDFKIKNMPIEELLQRRRSLKPNESELLVMSLMDRINWSDSGFSLSEEPQAYSITTVRKIKNSDQEIEFNMENESRGTQRLFTILGPLLQALSEGKFIVIDELDRSLHPALSKLLTKTFNQVDNNQGSQLLFSTHDTTLLDSEIFRRDQIWFTEKNEDRATQLYSLSELKPSRKKNLYQSSLQQNYLQGRYGAIPFISGGFQF